MENKWWIYCSETGVKLLPAFVYILANVFITRNHDYMTTLDELKREMNDEMSGYVFNKDLTFEDFTNGDYRIKSELSHLEFADNRVVHNGNYERDTIIKLLYLFGKEINNYSTIENEINFIHWYSHRTDMYISSPENSPLRDPNELLKFNKILDTRPYTKFCFEMLANRNRYNFLNQSNGLFILTNNKYQINLIGVEEGRKRRQNDAVETVDERIKRIGNGENIVGDLNETKFREMIKDSTILSGTTTTTLYPLNDQLTLRILDMNKDIKKFKKIRNFFLSYNYFIPQLFSIDVFKMFLSFILYKNHDITEEDVLLYLRYHNNPERYYINWEDN
jgi:hypothetical protein